MSKQYSESLRIGILLALAGSFLDAYTYLCRGKVFANAQTGNMVMLGISFLEGNTTNVIKYIIPNIAKYLLKFNLNTRKTLHILDIILFILASINIIKIIIN